MHSCGGVGCSFRIGGAIALAVLVTAYTFSYSDDPVSHLAISDTIAVTSDLHTRFSLSFTNSRHSMHFFSLSFTLFRSLLASLHKMGIIHQYALPGSRTAWLAQVRVPLAVGSRQRPLGPWVCDALQRRSPRSSARNQVAAAVLGVSIRCLVRCGHCARGPKRFGWLARSTWRRCRGLLGAWHPRLAALLFVQWLRCASAHSSFGHSRFSRTARDFCRASLTRLLFLDDAARSTWFYAPSGADGPCSPSPL